MAAGDWISVSVEIERWNLLVCQLSDLQALTGFIGNLATTSNKEKQAVHKSASPELSVVGKRGMTYYSQLSPCGHRTFTDTSIVDIVRTAAKSPAK